MKATSKLIPRAKLQNPSVIPLVHSKHKKPEDQVVESLKSTVEHQRTIDNSKEKVLDNKAQTTSNQTGAER